MKGHAALSVESLCKRGQDQ